MEEPQDTHTQERYRLVWFGTIICIVSTILYSCSNIILRELTGMRLDPRWILCVKEIVCVSAVVPVIIVLNLLGKYRWPKWKWVICIIIGGTVCEVVGAQLQLWAYTVVGIIVTIPLIQSANLIVAVIVGAFFLREKIFFRGAVAVGILVVSMICLIFGPMPDQAQELPTPHSTIWLILGGVGACVAGIAYAIYVVLLRYTSENREMPISLIMVIVTGIGVLVFGVQLLAERGFSGFYQGIPPKAWFWVLLTGVANTIGFYFQVLGLRYTVIARAQLIAAAQIVLITIVGILYFGEIANTLVWIGVSLTILGVLVITKPDKTEY